MSARNDALIDRSRLLLRDIQPTSRHFHDTQMWQRWSNYWRVNADFEPASDPSGQFRSQCMVRVAEQIAAAIFEPRISARLEPVGQWKALGAHAARLLECLLLTERELADVVSGRKSLTTPDPDEPATFAASDWPEDATVAQLSLF